MANKNQAPLNIFNRLPLPAAITIPFVLRVAVTLGVIGYLSYKNSQATVNELALQVKRELTQFNREVENLVNVDSLTETANRRHFDTRFEQEWRRLARDQQPLSLLLCDVDYF